VRHRSLSSSLALSGLHRNEYSWWCIKSALQ
jgi:hypothetical protein